MDDTVGLRRRRAAGDVFPADLPPPLLNPTNHHPANNNNNNNERLLRRLSRFYYTLSVLVAILAVVTVPHPQQQLSVETPHSPFTLNHPPRWQERLFPWVSGSDNADSDQQQEQQQQQPLGGWFLWMDPVLLHDLSPQTATDIVDKIIHSNLRLLLIANLVLSMTFWLHTAVADWFLGTASSHTNHRGGSNTGNNSGMDHHPHGRERLGGFLIFKLLLISAVVGPDTLDLLILLSWYTVLSFLRSLAHLCAATTQHTIQSGQPARPGVLHLLLGLLVCNLLAASVCVALFHGAGWNMVVLLTCDCVLLAEDVICNVLLHVGQVLEVQHAERMERAEDEAQNETNENGNPTAHDQRLARMEQLQARKVYILETTVFVLQLTKHILTVLHYVHIWTLYGVQFTLIDGVLALHLHSALSSACKKIAERRNLYRIARDMDGMFDNATDLELHKANAAGDVCCICLVPLTMGNVKKVGCGHLYHTQCLREVIERARSMEAARCPLCRASITTSVGDHGAREQRGQVPDAATTPATTATGAPPAVQNTADSEGTSDRSTNLTENNDTDEAETTATTELVSQQQPVVRPLDPLPNNRNPGDHALFRFDLPAWVPLPSFSFEVIRRPAQPRQPQQPQPDILVPNNDAAFENINNNEPSLLRRLLIVVGIVAMTPEEELNELENLVDTFPQYDRQALLAELRRRGSADAVARSILDRQDLVAPAQ